MLPPPFITDTYKFPVSAVNGNVLHFHRTFHSKSALLPLVAALLAATAHAETIISNPETELVQGQNTVQGIQISKYVRELKHFEKQPIRRGETRTFRFEIDPEKDLSFTDGDGNRFLEPGDYFILVKDKKVKLTLTD